MGASFAFFLASPIALKFFYTFQVERFSVLDPNAVALAKPLAELPLLGVDGKEYRPVTEEIKETGAEKKDPELVSEIVEVISKQYNPQGKVESITPKSIAV